MIGRKKETEQLVSAVKDDKSHFIAVYGRRRIGKTFLIREAFNYRFTFQHSGVYRGDLKAELFAFEASIKEAGGYPNENVKNWQEAFEDLKDLIRESNEQRKIIFLDELSWMDTQNSDLMMALESFWNGWASARKDIVLIVCASATTWMLSKVVHNKGGLYNRLTEQIHLEAFSLSECEEFVRAQGINAPRIQVLQYFLVFGGVPYYWTFIKKGLSPAQNIDRILFAENAPLKEEFDYLFASIFKNPSIHLKLIRALSHKKSGMTRGELIEESGLVNSGDITVKLDELEKCGFIRKYTAFGKKSRDASYQLIDNFVLFYYSFMENNPTDEDFWSHQINTPAINNWTGHAFESVCMLHIPQIKQKLGISGIYTEANSWYCIPDPDKGIFGSQIDLMIVRKDQVINLCEIKYSQTDYTMTKDDDTAFNRRISDLKNITHTKYAIYPTLITTYGLTDNSYSGNIMSVITLDDLFTIRTDRL